MNIGHSRPPDIAWTVSGTGASINTDPSDLTDGRPDTVVEFTWVSGVQNTSTTTKIRAEWSTGIAPGIVGISNIDLPAGTKIEVAFRRVGDPGGTYPYSGVPYVTSQRIVEGPRGERTAWFMFQGTTPVVGAQISIYNDVNGVASIIASQLFTIGEIFIGASDEVCVGNTASIDTTDPTVQQFSWNSQPYASPGTPYRQLNFALRTASETEWISTYAPLLAKIDRGQFGAFVLSWKDSAGNFSATKLHAYALIGLAKTQPTRTHVARAFYSSGQIQVVEAPIST
jgi:hypothetical protein